jgi:hypothetical protein
MRSSGLADGEHGLDRLELVAHLAELVLEALGLLLELALLGGERLVHRRAQVGDLLVDGDGLVALALLDLLVDALGLGPTTVRSFGGAVLPPFSPAATMTSPVGLEDDRLLSGAGP